MFFAIAAILVILWALGLVTAYTMTGLFYVLLGISALVALLRVISSRRTA